MHLYGRDQQLYNVGRTRGETWLLHSYTLTIGVQLACFLLAIIRTSNNAADSMRNNFFISSALDLSGFEINDRCTVTVETTRMLFSTVPYIISEDNIPYFISEAVTNVRMLFTCAALQLVVSTLSRLLVWMQIREVRYHFVVIHHELLIVWEVFLIVLCIVLLGPVNSDNKILSHFMYWCSDMSLKSFASASSYIELYVSFYVTLGLFALNLLAAIVVRLKQNPRDKWMKREAELRAMQATYRPQSGPLYLPRDNAGGVPGDFGNPAQFGTTAAMVAPEFGPCVSSPRTSTPPAPELDLARREEDGGVELAVIPGRGRAGGGPTPAYSVAGAPPMRFQPPPPPPPPSPPHLFPGTTSRARGNAQDEVVTDNTIELDYKV